MNSGRVIVAGGSGFVGRALTVVLRERGHDVVVLGRRAGEGPEGVRHVAWDGRTLGPWVAELNEAFAVVNLAGQNINCRFTPENRRLIVESRVNAVRLVTAAIGRCRRPPDVLIQASAIGFYGDSGDEWRDEDSPRGNGFLAEACVQWEAALDPATISATRCVTLRIGVVLARGGGALEPLARLTRWGFGGAAGSGRQYFSWIQLDDLNRIFLEALRRQMWRGVFNAVAPNPVTNAELMRELRHVLHRPWSPPAPRWVVRLGARLVGTDPSLTLEGQRVKPARLLAEWFEFRHPTLRQALETILGSVSG